MPDDRMVYVVTEGDYSEYHVCAIFSMREKAEGWIAKQRSMYSTPNTHDSYEIDEWTVDEQSEYVPTVFYGARIRVGDGHLVRMGVMRKMLPEGFRECEVFHSLSDEITVWSPVSHEHAEKVAVEKRQEQLRISGPRLRTQEQILADIYEVRKLRDAR